MRATIVEGADGGTVRRPRDPMTEPESERLERIRAALARYERPLVAFAARILGDEERARDVVQETFLRLCEARSERIEDRLAEWLYTVTRNRALDVRAKEQRMTPTSDPAVDTIDRHAPDPGARAVERETQGRVLGLVERLPDKQREVLRLKFQGGLSYAEIGRVTQQPTGTVGWLLHQGLKTLREMLGDELAADLEGRAS